MHCAMHQTMLQGLPIHGDIYEAKALGSSKKRKMSRPGDWNCRSCQHVNFYWRQSCRRCHEPRPEDISGTVDGQVRTVTPSDHWVPTFRPGDWYCGIATCHAHNFANRRFCYKCGVPQNVPSFGGNFRALVPPRGFGFFLRRGGSRRGWKPGDWLCGRRECHAHNYGTRVKCFKCNSSRELVGNASN